MQWNRSRKAMPGQLLWLERTLLLTYSKEWMTPQMPPSTMDPLYTYTWTSLVRVITVIYMIKIMSVHLPTDSQVAAVIENNTAFAFEVLRKLVIIHLYVVNVFTRFRHLLNVYSISVVSILLQFLYHWRLAAWWYMSLHAAHACWHCVSHTVLKRCRFTSLLFMAKWVSHSQTSWDPVSSQRTYILFGYLCSHDITPPPLSPLSPSF